MKAAYYKRANSYSKSYNAQMAEREGRFSATQFKKVYGIDPRTVTTATEWHHVGKFANRVDYYSIDAVMEALADMPYEQRSGLIKRGFKKYWDQNKNSYLADKLGNRVNMSSRSDKKPFTIISTYSNGLGLHLIDTTQWGRAFRKALATGRHKYNAEVKLTATGDPNFFNIVMVGAKAK